MSEIDKALDILQEETHKLQKNFAIKVEEVQALYLEVKNLRELEAKHQIMNGKLQSENQNLKQQIKQLEKEAEEMLNYP